jgi:large subunit ribosomal protein L18
MKKMTTNKVLQRKLRHRRVRSIVSGTAERPRLCVFRSNTRLTAQLIDDEQGITLAYVSSESVKGASPRERVQKAAQDLAKQAQEKGVTKVVFDRGGFQYTGSVKAFADAARDAGLVM